MAATDYVTLEELKATLKITDVRDDVALAGVIGPASRQVDNWTGRFFGQTDSQARYVSGDCRGFVEVLDLVSVSEVATDAAGTGVWDDVWPPAGYHLWPRGAAAQGLPYRELRPSPTGAGLAFPAGDEAVRVTGVWGWPAVPDPVRQAVVLQANRLWKRGTAPFGVVGSVETGQVTTITSLDPDVRALLSAYRVLAF